MLEKGVFDSISWLKYPWVEWLAPSLLMFSQVVLGRIFYFVQIVKEIPTLKQILVQLVLCIVLTIIANGFVAIMQVNDRMVLMMVGVLVGVMGTNVFHVLRSVLKHRFGIDIPSEVCEPIEKKDKENDNGK